MPPKSYHFSIELLGIPFSGLKVEQLDGTTLSAKQATYMVKAELNVLAKYV